jgi:DNA-directed RNA polymerase subunit M
MEFCPRCGAVLVQKNKRDHCPRCKYSSKNKVKLKTSEKIEEKKKINIISEKDAEVHPIIEQKCQECGNKKAFFWTLQTRATDEAETKFFKCTKCGFTWREYK